MRTTVTLEPDVTQKLHDLAHRTRSSFNAVLNEVIRRGLAAQERTDAGEAPFQVTPVAAGFRPSLDLGRLNQFADQLATDDFLRVAAPRA